MGVQVGRLNVKEWKGKKIVYTIKSEWIYKGQVEENDESLNILLRKQNVERPIERKVESKLYMNDLATGQYGLSILIRYMSMSNINAKESVRN